MVDTRPSTRLRRFYHSNQEYMHCAGVVTPAATAYGVRMFSFVHLTVSSPLLSEPCMAYPCTSLSQRHYLYLHGRDKLSRSIPGPTLLF